MGLFDNIFLDQDTPTAMLDGLLTDEQKQAQANAKKQEEVKSTSVIPEPEVVVENPVSEVSFDDVSATSSPETFNPSGFLWTHDESNPQSEGLSFDIWGIDLPSFGDTETTTVESDSSGSFLPVGTPIASEEVTFVDDTATDSTDASIALVQWATAATSDSIMDNTPTDMQQKTEETVLVSVGMPEETIVDEVTETTPVDAMSGGLLDMFSPSDEGEGTIPSLVEDEVEETATDAPITDIVADIAPVDVLDSTEEVSLLDTDSISSDTVDIVASIGASTAFQSHSPLHEMLSEFIDKLEKFNRESETLDTEMSTTENSLIKEEQDLKKEYEVRMSAIDYKRKHMEIERNNRNLEKKRLERIIANLKTEIV